jgi:hypothetical protein
MIRVSSIVLSLMAAVLVACRAAPPPTHSELLEKLHQCRDQLTQERPTGRGVSSCTKLPVSTLNGISRNELATVLGPPSFCTTLSEGGPPRGPDCPPQFDPKWSFHPIGTTGLELACETDEKQRCEVLRWNRTE